MFPGWTFGCYLNVCLYCTPTIWLCAMQIFVLFVSLIGAHVMYLITTNCYRKQTIKNKVKWEYAAKVWTKKRFTEIYYFTKQVWNGFHINFWTLETISLRVVISLRYSRVVELTSDSETILHWINIPIFLWWWSSDVNCYNVEYPRC